MTLWQLRFSTKAEKSFSKLDPQTRERVLNTLAAIANLEDPRARGKALTGNLSGMWRYRIGDYRVICELINNKLVILVIEIDHHRRIYD